MCRQMVSVVSCRHSVSCWGLGTFCVTVIASSPRATSSRTASMRVTAAAKWAHQDSNLGPTGYEPAALTAELWARAANTECQERATGVEPVTTAWKAAAIPFCNARSRGGRT